MKPDWDALMEEYSGSKSVVIGDVDCTAGGKALCDANGVKGYPTIKYGDPAALEDYEGGRSLSDLQKFASNLKPVCSPSNMELCDKESKAALQKVLAMSDADIDAQITEGEATIAAAESHFSTELEKLQASYQQLMKTRDETVAAVKASGLGQLKSVRAFKAAGGSAKDEL